MNSKISEAIESDNLDLFKLLLPNYDEILTNILQEDRLDDFIQLSRELNITMFIIGYKYIWLRKSWNEEYLKKIFLKSTWI